ncbi:helix-turn-helix transcriptional regulator [Aerobium aerolatum]|uniref:DNA-binding response regulator, NarL/FixJ family, contains REC and HTH domains n=1 Tax=Aquamicrobium aerolatum DSM 21857 TaxID=1121003 RepID=A0A1I3I7Y9_9HYPH|nr:response regulator transcription factor [Aquamicrobium aerolatum]SFI43863.1 DNA-binding response regulator, NarL/FixJ family, contains REC and HTH domains [Aquamicrobium aerolatum DSM 21857]
MSVEGGVRGGIQSEGRTLKVLIVVSKSGTLYQSLANTLEERLRGCIAQVRENSRGTAEIEPDVQLVLFHEMAEVDARDEIEAYRAANPEIAIGLLVDDCESITSRCNDLFATQKIQGILPLTLKLDIWLAAVSLLISGGEYYPVSTRRPSPEASVFNSNAESLTLSDHAPDSECQAYLSLLTARERETLELLSEGYQNKLIAHKMALSEHTVKVHVHNLLAKLRVSNRTQAAATLRRGGRSPSLLPSGNRSHLAAP